jgi:RNA polymerase sigma factor (sigma-70 family)
MSTDPASLLQRLQTRDDHEAWERFVELYALLLYFWACRLHLQAEDAADLVQEVFLALLQKLPAFRLEQHRSFRPWLRTLTHWRLRGHQRNTPGLPCNAPPFQGRGRSQHAADQRFLIVKRRSRCLAAADEISEHTTLHPG